MRGLRIAAPAQLRLQVGHDEVEVGWGDLSESARAAALALLASLIAKHLSVVGGDDDE